jgi:two-component system, cell cycle sensor histidine kinase and response regulator CckA
MPRGHETVLFVEDDRMVQDLAVSILTRQGYMVWVASAGDEVLRRADQNATEKLDLLLTDVVLPHVGGGTLTAQLKKHRPNLKVLYISGYIGRVNNPLDCPEPGAPILIKPFTPKILSMKVREVLDAM